jgi:hypothetical protein
MANKLVGSSSGNIAEVDANHNLAVNLPATYTQAGFATVQFEKDSGSITGSRDIKAPNVSDDNRLSVGLSTSEALYNFTTTSQNTADFSYAFTTMTMTQSSGFLNINPALATVSGNYAYLQSFQHFTLQGEGELFVELVGQSTGTIPPANQVLETGLFRGTAGTVPGDGVFFRFTSAGLVGVMSYGGVETVTAVMMATLPANTNGSYQIQVNQREAEFWLNGVKGAGIPVPAGQAIPYQTLNLPLCMMMRNTGTVTGGITTKIGTAHVHQSDIATNKSWALVQAIQGSAYQGQDGDAMGSLAIYSNSAIGAAAALTNTTAAAPNVGLGGVALVLPTLTAGTDGILFSYQNPAGSTTQPPKTLVVTGVSISSGVHVALTGGPLNLVYGVAYGHTALSLATAETGSFVTATTKAPRRVMLGVQNYAVTAAAGVGTTEIVRQFIAPIVVHPGQYFQITCRNLGTVTTLGDLAISATVDHYFE